MSFKYKGREKEYKHEWYLQNKSGILKRIRSNSVKFTGCISGSMFWETRILKTGETENTIRDWPSWRRGRGEHITQRHAKQRYGLALKQYQTMTKACEVCKSTNSTKRIGIDHDHVTGRVRGALCVRCNSVLGFVHDDVQILKDLTDYLQRNGN